MSLENNDLPDMNPTDSSTSPKHKCSPNIYPPKISVSINLKGSNPNCSETFSNRPKSSYNFRRPLNESSDSISFFREKKSRSKQRSSVEVKFRVIPSPRGSCTRSSIRNKFLPFSSNKIIKQKVNSQFETSKNVVPSIVDLNTSSSSASNWILLPFPRRESSRIHSLLRGHSGNKISNSRLQNYRVKKTEKENKVLHIRESYES